jgi:type I restriction enzyme, S subunit
MELKEKYYKVSDVGKIPVDWEVDLIKNLAKISTGAKNTQDRVVDGTYPFFVRSQNVERINTYSYDGEAILTAGDGVGTGKVHHYINGKFDYHQRVYKISDFCERISGYYFYLYFSNNFLSRITSLTAKSSVDSVRMDMIADMVIPIPSKSEQTAIATALSDTDVLIESLEKLLTKKRYLKLGTMQELLTARKRLPGYKEEWQTIELKDLVNQFIVPMRDKPKRFDGRIPWCRIEDFNGKYLTDSKSNQYVNGEIIKEMNLKVLPVDTLIVSCSADLGRCAIVKNALTTNQTFIGLVFNENNASNEFFYYYMTYNANKLNLLSSGTTISYLSREQFEIFKIYVPKTKSEQCAIAETISAMDSEIDTLEQKLHKFNMIKQGMIQALLTGKIRLS